jgi:hypothetical protein
MMAFKEKVWVIDTQSKRGNEINKLRTLAKTMQVRLVNPDEWGEYAGWEGWRESDLKTRVPEEMTRQINADLRGIVTREVRPGQWGAHIPEDPIIRECIARLWEAHRLTTDDPDPKEVYLKAARVLSQVIPDDAFPAA